MTGPSGYGGRSLKGQHVAKSPSRWRRLFQRTRLTEAKAKASLRAENQINLGKAYWDIPTRLAFGGAVLVGTWAISKYVGALPIGGVEVSQYLTAIAAQLQGIPGGQLLTGALGYVSQVGPLTAGAVAASYTGDRYKAGRKAQLEQAKNQAEHEKRAEQRQRGVDVDTDPYEQIHTLKQEKAELQAQVSELQQFKANAEAQFASINESLRNAYGAHVATNQRIDGLEQRPDDPHYPPPPPPGVGVKPPAPPPAPAPQMLSQETSDQTRNLLARAQQSKQAQENSMARQPAPTTAPTSAPTAGRHRGTTPYQAPSTSARPRR